MLDHREDLYDVTIIGGGPAGLFAAFYAGLREMRVKIIEAQPRLGGKVHLYPDKVIWDIGGLTPITGQQLIKQMVEQGLTFDPTVELNQAVTKISKNESDIFELETDQDVCHLSKTVIVAVGGGIINPMKLTLAGASIYEEGNLHYSVRSVRSFKDKTILISGGGPSAVDWANTLAPIAKQITLIYRGEDLKAHEADISKLEENEVEYLTCTEINDFIGEKNQIRAVKLVNNKTKHSHIKVVDAVIVNHGYQRDQRWLGNSQLDVHLKDDYYIQGTPMGVSSIPGLYAAGDILTHDGKLSLIAGAYQDAANAVNSAKLYMSPEAEDVGLVSSHNDKFKEKNKKYIYSSSS